jgi:2-keto-4-pentenoate hydratase/2-oxohepta-3-ene-1,7-dioic acid hydratase in catechol pathway
VLLDYEVELAMVLDDDIDPWSPAPRFGFFLANDLTVRTVQLLGEGSRDRMAFWGASKSFPDTLLCGPILSREGARLDRWPDLVLENRVNGDMRQRARTDQLLYTPLEVLRFAAAKAAPRGLKKGDVILTGTPGGIALVVSRWKRVIAELLLTRRGKLAAAFLSNRKNPRFLRAGDRLEMDGGVLGKRSVVFVEK